MMSGIITLVAIINVYWLVNYIYRSTLIALRMQNEENRIKKSRRRDTYVHQDTLTSKIVEPIADLLFYVVYSSVIFACFILINAFFEMHILDSTMLVISSAIGTIIFSFSAKKDMNKRERDLRKLNREVYETLSPEEKLKKT